MSDESIIQLVNLLIAVLALTAGTRIGYVLANRGTARDIDVIERHFANALEMSRHQHAMQLEADQQHRFREEMKSSYDSLAVWLHELERTFDEVRSGAQSTNESVRAKAAAIIERSSWDVINPPVELASCEFFWSGEVRSRVRKFLSPYHHFIRRARRAMNNSASSKNDHMPFDPELWESYNELLAVSNEIRDQMRIDLATGRPSLDG
jgi:hypothetical protein